ncbi:hypothetical protein SBD_1100 [Streptomyces bottropensis ATCC 25435]|uniref:Uncharacterized protein n=1 Tax=Streptomyces bottropensis ATCC 25435 TaxID=1054862 RepID=M3DN67_9ACTN|nr:hypothetical protein SBD_1100 [Streptomyces bottropensis ATCC 25435]
MRRGCRLSGRISAGTTALREGAGMADNRLRCAHGNGPGPWARTRGGR